MTVVLGEAGHTFTVDTVIDAARCSVFDAVLRDVWTTYSAELSDVVTLGVTLNQTQTSTVMDKILHHALRFYYLWIQWRVLGRGTNDCGWLLLISMLQAADLNVCIYRTYAWLTPDSRGFSQIFISLPDGVSLPFEALLCVSPEQFILTAQPYVLRLLFCLSRRPMSCVMCCEDGSRCSDEQVPPILCLFLRSPLYHRLLLCLLPRSGQRLISNLRQPQSTTHRLSLKRLSLPLQLSPTL
jgi:hypothetical protein